MSIPSSEIPVVVLEKLGLWVQSTCGPILTYHGQEGGYLETDLFWCRVLVVVSLVGLHWKE